MFKSVEKIYGSINNSFVSYKVILLNDQVWSVPLDPANTDYQAIQKWIEDGGVVIDNGANN